MIERLGIAVDQRHLDVAAGTGEPGLSVARRAPEGQVVLADLAAEMLGVAAPGYVSSLYQAAGLREVAEWDVGVELVTRSPAQYWDMISEHVSLAVAALAQVGAQARRGSRPPSSPGRATTSTTAG